MSYTSEYVSKYIENSNYPVLLGANYLDDIFGHFSRGLDIYTFTNPNCTFMEHSLNHFQYIAKMINVDCPISPLDNPKPNSPLFNPGDAIVVEKMVKNKGDDYLSPSRLRRKIQKSLAFNHYILNAKAILNQTIAAYNSPDYIKALFFLYKANEYFRFLAFYLEKDCFFDHTTNIFTQLLRDVCKKEDIYFERVSGCMPPDFEKNFPDLKKCLEHAARDSESFLYEVGNLPSISDLLKSKDLLHILQDVLKELQDIAQTESPTLSFFENYLSPYNKLLSESPKKIKKIKEEIDSKMNLFLFPDENWRQIRNPFIKFEFQQKDAPDESWFGCPLRLLSLYPIARFWHIIYAMSKGNKSSILQDFCDYQVLFLNNDADDDNHFYRLPSYLQAFISDKSKIIEIMRQNGVTDEVLQKQLDYSIAVERDFYSYIELFDKHCCKHRNKTLDTDSYFDTSLCNESQSKNKEICREELLKRIKNMLLRNLGV